MLPQGQGHTINNYGTITSAVGDNVLIFSKTHQRLILVVNNRGTMTSASSSDVDINGDYSK